MSWDYFKALLPTMLTHLFFTVVIFSVVWWYVRETFSTITFKYSGAVALAAAFSLYSSMGTMVQISQNQRLSAKQQELSQQAAQQQAAALPGNNPNLQLGSEPELAVRKQFLQVLEQLVSNPQQATDQTRQQVLGSFQGVYGNQQLSQLYKANVVNFFLCGKTYLTDAIASIEQKKEVRSQDQKTCATLPGEFYSRKTLLPEEMMALYDRIISSASKGRYPASKDLPTLDILKKNLEQQNLAVQVAGFLFP